MLNFISGSSTPCQDDILQFGESPWHFAPGKSAPWRLKEKISSTEFLEGLTSLHFWLDELCCGQDGCATGQNLGLCPLKPNTKKYGDRVWRKYKMKVTQSCPTLCDPLDYTVHGILQAKTVEWVAFLFSRGSFQPRDQRWL